MKKINLIALAILVTQGSAFFDGKINDIKYLAVKDDYYAYFNLGSEFVPYTSKVDKFEKPNLVIKDGMLIVDKIKSFHDELAKNIRNDFKAFITQCTNVNELKALFEDNTSETNKRSISEFIEQVKKNELKSAFFGQYKDKEKKRRLVETIYNKESNNKATLFSKKRDDSLRALEQRIAQLEKTATTPTGDSEEHDSSTSTSSIVSTSPTEDLTGLNLTSAEAAKVSMLEVKNKKLEDELKESAKELVKNHNNNPKQLEELEKEYIQTIDKLNIELKEQAQQILNVIKENAFLQDLHQKACIKEKSYEQTLMEKEDDLAKAKISVDKLRKDLEETQNIYMNSQFENEAVKKQLKQKLENYKNMLTKTEEIIESESNTSLSYDYLTIDVMNSFEKNLSILEQENSTSTGLDANDFLNENEALILESETKNQDLLRAHLKITSLEVKLKKLQKSFVGKSTTDAAAQTVETQEEIAPDEEEL